MKYPFVGFIFHYSDDDADYLERDRCSACHRRERANTSTMYLAGPSGGYNSNEVGCVLTCVYGRAREAGR